MKQKQLFSEALKRLIVEQVSTGVLGAEAARRQYGIKGKSAILGWQRNLRQYGQCSLTLPKDFYPALSTRKPSKDLSPSELQARIKQLERQLEDEQLRSEAYQRMINIAEEQFNIPIRKKPDTK